VQVLGEGRSRRDREEGEEAVQFLRSFDDEVAVPAQDVGRVFEWIQHWSRVVRVDRVRLVEEGCDDAEVATTAAHGPEEVGVFLCVRGDESAVCEDHVDCEEVVDREPALARQVADAAAERESTDAGGRDDAGRHREAERVARVIDVAPLCAAAGEDRPLAWIDPDPSHW